MAYEFKIGYDNITNLAAPGYNEREISTLLTKAQEQLYYGIINPESNKLNDGIESTEKRRVDLSEFIRDAECTLSSNQVGAHQYGVFFDLPSDFFYTLSEDAHSNIPDCTQPGSVELFLDPSSLDLASAQFTIGETITDGLSVYTIVVVQGAAS